MNKRFTQLQTRAEALVEYFYTLISKFNIYICLQIILNSIPAFLLYVLIGPIFTVLVFLPIIVLQLPLKIYKRIGFSVGSFALIYGLIWLDSENAEYQLKKICEAEAGLKIYGRLENVKGVNGILFDEKTLLQTKFHFLESGPGLNVEGLPKFRYLRRQSDGSIIQTSSDIPEADVVITHKNGGFHSQFIDIAWSEYLVTDRINQRILARYRYVYRYGSLLSRIQARYSVFGYGSGKETNCPDGERLWSEHVLQAVTTAAPLAISVK